MQQHQIHVGQSLRQAQQFLVVHASAVPSAFASAARQQLDTAVAELDTAAIAQGTLTRESRGEVRRRAQLERTLVKKYLTPLANYARASLKGAPDYAALTPSARALERERLVKTAQAMAEAAGNHAADLSDGHFPADFLDQLRSAAGAVQASLDAGAAGRVRRTGVTKEIRVALASGRQAVAKLDSLVRFEILGDEALEREWRAAKRVRRSGTPDAAVTTNSGSQPETSAVATTATPRGQQAPGSTAQEVPAAA